MAGRLLERDRELHLVFDALDRAVAGRGDTVVLEGPAGIGKTSLLEDVREAARARSVALASTSATELETAYAWGVARGLLEPRLRGMTDGTRRQALAGAAALAEPIVLPGAREVDADPTFGVLHGLYWLVAGLAAEQPQVLVVDDLHWADDASARFLAFLANRLGDLPVLLVAAARPGAVRLAPAAALELAPLSVAATGELLARHGSPRALAEPCHRATGGNPLLVRALAERRPRDAEALVDIGPDAVARAVDASLARLGDEPVRLARAVAVLGTTPMATAARLAAVDAAAAPAEALVRAGILRDTRPLEFEHALVRDAVLRRLTAGERAALHGRAAQLLADDGAPPEAVAVHLLAAEPSGDRAAARTLAAAGRRALASGAPGEAAACLARALAEPPPAAERAALLLDLARAEHALGRRAALDHVMASSACAADPRQRAEAALALVWATGPGAQDPQEAFAMVDAAIAEVAGTHPELELQLHAVRLATLFLAPELVQGRLGEAERFADLEGRTPGECAVLAHVAMHRFALGRPASDVAEPAARAVADPGSFAAIGPDSVWLHLVLGQLFKSDRLEIADRTVDLAFAEAQRRGSAPGFAAASVWRAWIALRRGSAAEAEAHARAAYEVLPPGAPLHGMSVVSCLVEVLVERGVLEEANAVLARAGLGDGAAQGGDGWMLYARSILRAAGGDRRGALADQLASRRLVGLDDPDPDFDGWLRIARLLHATGDAAGAAREARRALRWARVWDTPAYIGQALTVTGLVAADGDGLAPLHEAVEHLERSPARRELARSLVELGAALRRAGDRRAARVPLRRALEIADAGGLVATGARAREELRVTGARVPQREASGVGSLTPSERRIAGLAAEGASNPEIAQALFLSVKTVEMHLGNAYRKLDVHTRGELAPMLGSGTGSSP
jgi:DNA-binding CsgD family transcriptional regulator